MRVVLDAAKCTGHGRCYVLAPELFGDDDRGYGVVLHDATVRDDQRALVDKAIASCPEGAITIVD